MTEDSRVDGQTSEIDSVREDRQPEPLPRLAAMLVGVLSVAAALAAGHLIAGFFNPNVSPFLAVGDTAIDIMGGTPLKEFAIRTFGTNDKLVLLASMAAVIFGLALVSGLLSRRSSVPGTVLAVGLGIVGILAVIFRPAAGPLDPLAPAASLLVGVVVFRFLHRYALLAVAQKHDKTGSHSAQEKTEPAKISPDRRKFLLGSVGVALGAGFAGTIGQLLGQRGDVEGSRAIVTKLVSKVPLPITPAGADFVSSGSPSFITPNRDFYRVDTALAVPRVRAEDWSLRIHGMVDRELNLSFADIAKRQLVAKTITMTCVSNEVGGPYISTANFIGVPLRDLLDEAGIRQGADQVFSRSVDGYTAGSPVADIMDSERNAMVAIGMNGEALPIEHGFPARLVVPGLYGYVSATKWVTDIELTTFAAKQSYWVPRGYSAKAPIKTESRIDTPVGLSTLPSGKVIVAGTAWAQPKGIAKVELQMDGGAWQEADLATDVNGQTWRMWRKEYDLRSGTHSVVCRATDKSGYVQTSDRTSPLPDGATGWQTIVFTTN